MSLGFTHEVAVGGKSVEWYTPPEVFKALGLTFDLDPCAPRGGLSWIPSRRFYWLPEFNGLHEPWEGRVWLNPPYGPSTARWLARFAEHRNGIALVFSRTGNRWAQRAIAAADAVLFVSGRLNFVDSNGRRGGKRAGADSMLLACGLDNAEALRRSGLGVVLSR